MQDCRKILYILGEVIALSVAQGTYDMKTSGNENCIYSEPEILARWKEKEKRFFNLIVVSL